MLYERLAPFHDQIAFTGASVHGRVAHCLGLLSSELGRDDADSYFAEALETHQRFQTPYFIAATQLAWTQYLIERANPTDYERAETMRTEARATAIEYGFAGLEAKADRLTATS